MRPSSRLHRCTLPGARRSPGTDPGPPAACSVKVKGAVSGTQAAAPGKGRTLYLTGEQSAPPLTPDGISRTRGCFPPWASVLAAVQTRGRGQLRREWHSPPGEYLRCHASARRVPLGAGNIAHPGGIPRPGRVAREEGSKCGSSGPMTWFWKTGKCAASSSRNGRASVLRGSASTLLTQDPVSPFGRRPPWRRAHWIRQGLCSLLQHSGVILCNAAENCYELLLSSYTSSEFTSLVQQRLAFQGRRVALAGHPDVQGRIAGVSDTGGLILRERGVESVVSSGSIHPVDR
jgi:BirA family transcriptional regulator, biotin operon repressor / biotin---[acetyl-CoA-carboxylase] ligase